MRDRLRREDREGRVAVARAAHAHAPDVAAVLRMQACAGNAATTRLLAREPKAPEQERTIVFDGLGTSTLVSMRLMEEKTLNVVLPDGPLGPRLAKAALDSTPLGKVMIAASGHSYELDDALAISCEVTAHTGPPLVTVTLQGSSLHVH